MNYKKIIINTIIIFILNFIAHFTYTLIPTFFTSIFFPVNESIMEHVKMLFTTGVVFTFISYIFIKDNNVFIKAFLRSLILCVILLILYLPIYYTIGENLPLTLVILFITILLEEILFTFIPINKDNNTLNIIGLILLIITYIIFTIWTYFPPKVDLFRDPENNTYGIKLDNRTS